MMMWIVRWIEASDDDDGVDFVDVHVGNVNEGDGVGIGQWLREWCDRPSARAGSARLIGRPARGMLFTIGSLAEGAHRGRPARFRIDDYVY